MGSPPYSLKEETVREILELEVEFLPEADYLKRLCYGDWELPHCTQAPPLALSPTLPSSSRAFTLCQQLRLSSSVHRCEASPIVAPRHRQATSKLSDTGTTTLSWNVIIVYYRVLGSIRKRHETIAM
ncbi:hypothetical protein F2Q69_00039093 [Brassica cretica]|uniref:Uncharacterized protein n=1 Tax=Brassica cretica TaxID=69181 RepID=A0A8S9SS72_BRACR|nr:hypothetical protein F2Q69_00039093 [Brassica cretica]